MIGHMIWGVTPTTLNGLMADKKFNDDWEALPSVYKTRFLEILEERGLASDFDSLADEHKAQILDIIKEHILGETEDPDAVLPPSPDPPKK